MITLTEDTVLVDPFVTSYSPDNAVRMAVVVDALFNKGIGKMLLYTLHNTLENTDLDKEHMKEYKADQEQKR